MTFEIYHRRDRRMRGSFVHINKNGMLSLSYDAWDALGMPAHVELLFVPGQRVFGMRAAQPGEDTFAVNDRKIHAKSFLAYVGLWPDKSGTHINARMDNGVLVFALEEMGNAHRAI